MEVPKRLLAVADQLQVLNPSFHSVKYNAEPWKVKFPGDEDLESITANFPIGVSRGDLFELAGSVSKDLSHVRRLFFAVMIWGYGTDSRGPWRVSQMLSHPNAIERLVSGARLVQDQNFKQVYLHFRMANQGKLAQFGPSFMTKFFYFIGAACGLNPMPLILDNRVALGMDMLARDGDNLQAIACVSGGRLTRN